MSKLDYYLKRIGYTGKPQPDFQTLCELHRLHLQAIPYENFDIHLGRKIVLDETAFFNKLVIERRGGWCYEMNGLFAWALREVGFNVHLLAGSVRAALEEKILGNHLVLLVDLERPYVVDVGFGDGFREPLPLEEGEYTQGFLSFRLARESDYWVFHNHPAGGAMRYDFPLNPYELHQFADMCHELQTSPTSGFVKTTVAERITADELFILRGAVLKRVDQTGIVERTIESEAEYRQVLKDNFLLDLGDTSDLWPKVWSNHQQWLLSLT